MFEVVGVYEILSTVEPVHLVEVAIDGRFEDVQWGSVTQGDDSQEPSNWQVAYDERSLGQRPDRRTRAVFFFHYLRVDEPLISAHGTHPLPAPTQLPLDLAGIEYEQP